MGHVVGLGRFVVMALVASGLLATGCAWLVGVDEDPVLVGTAPNAPADEPTASEDAATAPPDAGN